MLFFMKVVDGVISFWAPVQIQAAFKNEFVMGLIISSQSIFGFLADLIFPSFLKKLTTQRLVIFGFVSILTTTLILTGSIFWPFLVMFELAMVMWALYFELFSFSGYQFVSTQVPLSLRSGTWGIIDVFRNLGVFFGPLIAAWFLPTHYLFLEVVLILFLLIGFVLFYYAIYKRQNTSEDLDVKNINLLVESKHWLILSKSVWPAVSMSLLLNIIDATFWTVGSIWTITLIKQNGFGSLLLPAYIFPSLFFGLILAKLNIYRGKKILTEKMLIIAGAFLMLMAVNGSVYWVLAMDFLSACFGALAYPLLDGVYSDLIARMGREKKDMIGLTSATVNLAYIVWSPIAGLIAIQIGERMTFSYLGLLIILASIGLLYLTPKKLRLPQEEIKSWDH